MSLAAVVVIVALLGTTTADPPTTNPTKIAYFDECMMDEHVILCLGIPKYVQKIDKLSINQTARVSRSFGEFYIYLHQCSRDQRAAHRYLDAIEAG